MIALGKPARSFHIQISLIKLIRLFANIHLANALFYIIRLPINTEKHNSTSFYVKTIAPNLHYPASITPLKLPHANFNKLFYQGSPMVVTYS
jgi:hypothetical protein